jgi:hypothetical protein
VATVLSFHFHKLLDKLTHYVGFEVSTAVVMKSTIFWDITPCSLLATCFQAGFLLGIFLDPEDGGDMFFRNVGRLSTDCTELYPRRQYSSS